MSDFVDNEAEESDVSEDESVSDARSVSDAGSDAEASKPKGKEKKPEKKKKTKAMISDDSDDEEEDEDEAAIAEEMKDFINEDIEEEGEEEGDDEEGEAREKRKHESDVEEDLEDEDYDLIEENLGIKVKRQKKHKRIRVLSDDEDSDKDEKEGEDREAIEKELFDGEEGSEVEEDRESHRPAEGTEFGDLGDEDEEEDDMDNFIVDDDGQPIKSKKKKKHIIHTDSSLQEAQDIFGVDFDFEEFEQYGEDEDEEEDFEDEYLEDEAEGEEGEGRAKTKKKRRTTRKGIFDVFEPSELERGFFTDADAEIRNVDMPERFQLRQIPVKKLEEGELEEEAEWIAKQAFMTPPVSQQNFLEQDRGGNQFGYYKRGAGMGNKIKEAIKFMRNKHFEVPFIAFYRKEYVLPELNIDDLWKVWHWDEKWTQLRSRKQNMVRLFERMQTYQFDQNSDPDKIMDTNHRGSLPCENLGKGRR